MRINDATSTTLANVLAGKEPLEIQLDRGRGAFDFVSVVRNVGDASLNRPLLLLAGDPRTVRFEPSQFSGPAQLDILPFTQIDKGYRFESRAIVPADVSAFDFLFDISGENMAAQSVRIHVRIPGAGLEQKQN